MLTDDHMDALAAIYRLNPRIRNSGVSFAEFAADPGMLVSGEQGAVSGNCSLFTASCSPEFRPLLPAQRRVAARIAVAWRLRAACVEARTEVILDRAGYRVRCGIWVLPLHHRAWPRHPMRQARQGG